MAVRDLAPTCLATILCEKVLEDTRSRNKTYVDCFNSIFADRLPFAFYRCAIVVSLTSIHSPSPGKVTIRTPAGKTLLELAGEFAAESPLDVVELVFDIRNLVFSQPGEHTITVHAGEKIVASRKFVVALASKPADQERP